MPKAPRVASEELARIRAHALAHGGAVGRKRCPRPGCHASVVLTESNAVCLTCGWVRAATDWETTTFAFSAAQARATCGEDFRALRDLVVPEPAKRAARAAKAEARAAVAPAHAPAVAAPSSGGLLAHTIPTLPADAPRVLIYTDGGCEPNPGPGGWAAILWTEGVELELAGGARSTTNNRMEITAALEGLRALKNSSRVTVITDSQYLSNGMTDWITAWSKNRWRRKGDLIPNHELWEALARAALAHETSWAWTRGHSGQPENERCDRLAAAMIAQANAGAEAPSHRARRERPGRLLHVHAQETTTIWLAP
jgi:ribonuclease HI